MEFPFIFGDLENWIRVIVVLLFFLSPLLNWLGGKQDKPQQAPRRPRARPPQPPGQQPPQRQPMGQGRAALENEIEDFLRRAGRGGQQQPDQPQARPAAKPRPQRPPQARPAAQPLRTATRAEGLQREGQQRPPLRPTEPPAKTGPSLGEGVARHVREHIEAHPVSEHSRQLGRGIAQTDEKVEDHLHQIFDHSLGQLQKKQVFQDASEGTDASVWGTKQQSNRAAELRQLLQDPQSLRNAIIITELFNRPLGWNE